jgi:hypothetical protein
VCSCEQGAVISHGLIVAEVNLGQVGQDSSSSKKSSSNKSNSELSKEDVEYSHAIVIDNSLSSYPSDDPGNSFVDGRFTNATDESKIELIDSNDNDRKNASQSMSATDTIVNAFGESSYTTERGRVTESLDNWTRVVKQSRKGHANKD